MSDPPVFLDTVALLASVHRRDALHTRTRSMLRELAAARSRFVTTQWVLAEFLGHACAPSLRAAAIADTHRILASPSTEVVPATPESWQAAFEL